MARGGTNDKINIITRQIMALDLRKAGYSYRAIAERCHVTQTQAHTDVQKELARLDDISKESASELKLMELERLDMAIKGLMPFVEAGSSTHATALVSVVAQRAKLLGLYAPEQHEDKVTVVDELSDDERARRINSILERARTVRDRRPSPTVD